MYPAAGLLYYAPANIPVYLIDPKPMSVTLPNLTVIAKKATEGMKAFVKYLS